MNYSFRLRKCVRLISSNRKIIYFTILLFLISVVFGYFHSSLSPDDVFGELGDSLVGKNYFYIALFIFLNNIKSSFFSILLGVLFLPIIATIVNGYVIGSISSYLVSENGITLPVILLSLIPHGVFELPAIIVSFGFGLKITVSMFSGVKKIKKAYSDAFFVFFNLVAPLLFIAALVEASLFFI